MWCFNGWELGVGFVYGWGRMGCGEGVVEGVEWLLFNGGKVVGVLIVLFF